MKKFFLLLSVITLLAGSFSCSKKDNAKPNPPEWIYGTWNVTHAKTVESDDWTPAGTLGWYAQFNKDKTYKSESTDSFSGTYSMKGSKITCKVGGATIIYTILEHTDNTATAKMNYDDEPNDFIWFKIVKE